MKLSLYTLEVTYSHYQALSPHLRSVDFANATLIFEAILF